MKRPIALILLFLFLAVGSFLILDSDRPEPDTLLPNDILALVVINRLPDSFDFLERTRLSNWIDIEPHALEDRVRQLIPKESLDLFRDSVESAWLCIQGLQAKGDVTYRIDFSGVIVPARFARDDFERGLVSLVQSKFGGEAVEVLRNEGTTVIRGPQPGQVFYVGERSGFILISNNEAGWRKLELTSEGILEPLASHPPYRKTVVYVGTDMDLLLYVSPAAGGGLIPGLGYGIRVEGERVVESSISLENEER